MAIEYPDTRIGRLNAYAGDGVWRFHPENGNPIWIWTLKDMKAFLVLAALTTLFAFTQSRAWVIIRLAILHWTKPIRLPDDTMPEPLLSLSQGAAVEQILPLILRASRKIYGCTLGYCRTPTFRQELSVHQPSPTIPSYFGFFALLNISLFIMMGITTPWLLTGGSLEAPLVKSLETKRCVESTGEENELYDLGHIREPDAILQQCMDKLHMGCENQYWLRALVVRKSRTEDCIFPRNICKEGIKPISITHSNITAFEMRINSPLKATIEHRLSCVPVYLDPFILTTAENNTYILIRDIHGNETLEEKLQDLGLFTKKINTPNELHGPFNQSSGYRAAMNRGPYDLKVLPKYYMDGGILPDPSHIHPLLFKNDGRSFLIILRTGSHEFVVPIDDPFFAAHNHILTGPFGNFSSYYADYEATALGCLEQFRYCTPSDGFCTPWGVDGEEAATLLERLKKNDKFSTPLNLFFIYPHLPFMLSVYHYLSFRTTPPTYVPLTQFGLTSDEFVVIHQDTKDQWAAEVETWFTKATLSTVLKVKTAAEFQIFSSRNSSNKEVHRQLAPLCGSILFRSGDYTNLSWIEFCATAGGLVFLCMLSYMLQHRWHHYFILCSRKLMLLCINLICAFGNKLKASRTIMGVRNSISTVWSMLADATTIMARKLYSSQSTMVARRHAQGSENIFMRPISSDDDTDWSLHAPYVDIDNVI